MRPVLIVIDPPCFDLLSGILERDEHMSVQTLVTKSSVETLNHRILHVFSRSDKIQLYPVGIGPGIQRLRDKFTLLVHGDHLGISLLLPLDLHP
jgi:hypothetical protein